MMEESPGSCKKTHASDLNKYIQSHPDEISGARLEVMGSN
jgi:hypothetical protein